MGYLSEKGLQQFQLTASGNGGGTAVHIQLFVNILEVFVNRSLRNDQDFSNLLIGTAL